MNNILCRQLALDYCCTEKDVADGKNHFSIYYPAEGRRVYDNDDDTLLKAAVVGGKILFSGKPAIIDWCREKYSKTEGMLKGFITGFTSFFGTLILIILVAILRNKMK